MAGLNGSIFGLTLEKLWHDAGDDQVLYCYQLHRGTMGSKRGTMLRIPEHYLRFHSSFLRRASRERN
ncbi:hypothetical protein MTR_7g024720 [Medicago truncatula]|uniref:Uncharacterized protein n=1 Tax=Medicago truncatula TaxID=3880 RepID=G7KXU8_MEDTR|nr:hypothetical protein MTR_7g024720 [Medicago truncatula]